MANFDEMDDGPLEIDGPLTSFPKVPAEMVASIALGMEDELIVAARHGFSIEQYSLLQTQPYFQRMVDSKRSELKKDGVTFKIKAGFMADALLEKAYVMAMQRDASLSSVHEVLKTTIKAAGLEPRPDPTVTTGNGFSISIDLGNNQSISLTASPSANSSTLPAIDMDDPVTDVTPKEAKE